MSGSPSTPTSLLTLCQNNQPEGWEKLKILYGKLILYWCWQAGLAEEDRYDVFQDVMLTLVSKIHTFRRDHPNARFRSWLRSVTNSRISDFYRHKQKEPLLYENFQNWSASHLEEPDSQTENEERDILFQQIFHLLKSEFSEQSLEAFRLMSLRGSTSEEVGKTLGMSAGAVRAAKKRIVDRIRGEFEELL